MNEERTALRNPCEGAMPEKMALNVTEVAEVLGISRSLMYTIIHRADFPAFKMGTRTLTGTADLRAWVSKMSQTREGMDT